MKLFNFHQIAIMIRLTIVSKMLKIIRRLFCWLSNLSPEISTINHAKVLNAFAVIHTAILLKILEVKRAKKDTLRCRI